VVEKQNRRNQRPWSEDIPSKKSKFNRAFQALRQTGSAFKPIIYTAALENGFSPASIIDDSPFSYIDEWTGILWETQEP